MKKGYGFNETDITADENKSIYETVKEMIEKNKTVNGIVNKFTTGFTRLPIESCMIEAVKEGLLQAVEKIILAEDINIPNNYKIYKDLTPADDEITYIMKGKFVDYAFLKNGDGYSFFPTVNEDYGAFKLNDTVIKIYLVGNSVTVNFSEVQNSLDIHGCRWHTSISIDLDNSESSIYNFLNSVQCVCNNLKFNEATTKPLEASSNIFCNPKLRYSAVMNKPLECLTTTEMVKIWYNFFSKFYALEGFVKIFVPDAEEFKKPKYEVELYEGTSKISELDIALAIMKFFNKEVWSCYFYDFKDEILFSRYQKDKVEALEKALTDLEYAKENNEVWFGKETKDGYYVFRCESLE